jgi:hypothetical protein
MLVGFNDQIKPFFLKLQWFRADIDFTFDRSNLTWQSLENLINYNLDA